jgi:hypothetical protein
MVKVTDTKNAKPKHSKIEEKPKIKIKAPE